MKITGTASVVIQKSNLGMAVSATKPADEPAACWIGWVLAFLCSCLVWDCYLSISTKLERPFYTICLHLYSVWGSSFPRVWFDLVWPWDVIYTSLSLTWGLPVGRIPCDSLSYRRSFWIHPSPIWTTWPSHHMHLYLRWMNMDEILALKDSAFGEFVLPGCLVCDGGNTFLLSMQSPWLTTVEKCAHHTSLVDLHFGPHSLCQSGQGCDTR